MSEKTNQVADHIKESMCVDGSVEVIQNRGVVIKDSKGNYRIVHGMMFECNDSKRGQFFVGWFVPDDENDESQ